MMYHYSAFGLSMQSDLAFSELLSLEQESAGREANIKISAGYVNIPLDSEALDNNWIFANKNIVYCHFKDIGRFCVERGTTITYQLDLNAGIEDLKPYLLPLSLAIVAHQRGRIPLHLAALKTSNGILLLTGVSGTGKSTVAAAASKQKYWPILCDDLAIFDPSAQPPCLHFPFNSIKLYEKTAFDQLELTNPLRPRYASEMKFHFSIPTQNSIPLNQVKNLVLLKWGQDFEMVRQSQTAGFTALMNSLVLPLLVGPNETTNIIRTSILSAAALMSTYDVTRNKDDDASLNLVIENLASITQ